MKQDFRTSIYLFSPLFFWLTVVGIFYLLSLQNPYSLLATPLMFSLHHGNHETVHGTLVPKVWKGSKRLNLLSGFVGFAIVGHNYVLMRRSHNYHHLCGRLHASCTIEMSDENQGVGGKITYYLSLLGLSSVYHELAGYVFPLLPAEPKFLGVWYYRMNCRSKTFLSNQLFVLFFTLLLIYVGGFYFLVCRLLFLPLWGLGQNVSHYALPVEQGKFPEFAARTYRVNSAINFFFYGAGFYHFEHHVMPKVPGLMLWHPTVGKQIESKLGCAPAPRVGIIRYVQDALCQFSGPYPQQDQEWSLDGDTEELVV